MSKKQETKVEEAIEKLLETSKRTNQILERLFDQNEVIISQLKKSNKYNYDISYNTKYTGYKAGGSVGYFDRPNDY